MSAPTTDPQLHLGVNDIRPNDLQQGQRAAYERDLEKLRRRLPDFVAVACPACGSGSARFVFEKYRFQFQRCSSCRTIYMSPRPSPEIMAGYYGASENYRYWAEHIFPASEPARRERIHRPMLEYIVEVCERYQVKRDLLIEVGPGFGTFAALAGGSGKFGRVLTVERTPEMAQACRARGVEVIERAIEEVTATETGLADVLVSFEVIEHLFNPATYIEHAARLIRPGGLLVLTCPNGDGFDTATLGPRSSAVDSEHVNLFNPTSLAMLVERSGFGVVECETPGRLDAELVRNAVLAGELDLEDGSFLRTVLVDQWDRVGAKFQAFLAANRLSGHLRLVARRLSPPSTAR